MIHEEKILIMSQLAILDKYNIKKDLKITSYYPEDYVYLNNLKTRVSILIITVLGACGYLLFELEKEIVIPTTGVELFKSYLLPYGSVILGVLLFYTILSTRVYNKRYREAQERVNTYQQLLKELDRLEAVREEERRMYDGKRKTFSSTNQDNQVL